MSIRKEIAGMERTFKEYTGQWYRRPTVQTFIGEVEFKGSFPTVQEIIAACGNVPYENVLVSYSEEADAFFLTMQTKANDIRYHSDLSAEISALFGYES